MKEKQITKAPPSAVCIMCVQYIGGCSLHWGLFSTSGGGGGVMHVRDTMSTSGMFTTSKDTMSTSGDIMGTSGGYREYIGGCSVHWGFQ